MKNVTAYQCEFCGKTSLYKSNMKKHEAECFYNPVTKSCASCVWFSRVHDIDGVKCFLKKFPVPDRGEKAQLKFNCADWQSSEYIMLTEDIYDNPDMVEKLIEGDRDYFKKLNESNRVEHN